MRAERWAAIVCGSHVGWWNPVPMRPHAGPHRSREEWPVVAVSVCLTSMILALGLINTIGLRAAMDELKLPIRSLRPWWRDPWRRHGQLITGLPLTRADAAADGDVVAVSGRVVGGGPPGDDEADAQRVTGHLVLDDGSSVHIQVGRPGAGLVGESFSIGDPVFALGVAVHADGAAAHPFRDRAHLITLLPGDDGLFVVGREPRELVCVRMAERASTLRDALRPSFFVISLLMSFVSGVVCLLLR